MNDTITGSNTVTGSTTVNAYCQYRLPCGYCTKLDRICPMCPITVTPTWQVTCEAK